jgi:ankyrin repeat protein
MAHPILFAASEGALAQIKELLAYEPDCVNEVDHDFGATPLIFAALKGHAKAVAALADAPGTNLNHAARGGVTACWVAVFEGHAAVVKALAERGADITTPSSGGRTLCFIAAERGHVAVVRELVARAADGRVDVNRPDDNSATPCWIAAQEGHANVISVLAEAGANVQLADANGVTPAWIATQQGHEDALTTLAENHADMNTPDNQDVTPCWMAVQERHPNCCALVEVLGKNGADLNTRVEGFTLPFCAAFYGHEPMIRQLSELGSDVKQPNADGKTPCWAAYEMKQKLVLRVLQELGVDVKRELGIDVFAPINVYKKRAEESDFETVRQVHCHLATNHFHEKTISPIHHDTVPRVLMATRFAPSFSQSM